MEATWMFIDRGLDKADMVHIYNRLRLIHNKKKQNNAIYSDMDGPRNCPTEWGKSYRERHISYDIIYMWNLKKKIV